MAEASWGADPLESEGGFRDLRFDPEVEYPSSLASNGRVSWSCQKLSKLSNEMNAAEATLTVGFTNVDWAFLRSVYGWAALQYQAWTRGYMTVDPGPSASILLYIDGVLEFWIDDQHFFGGDFYAYRNTPVVLHLAPGRHQLDIRLIRDVRVMGGNGDPSITIKLKVERAVTDLAIVAGSILVSEVVDGLLASPFASIAVRNNGKNSLRVLDIGLQPVRCYTDHDVERLLNRLKMNLTVLRLDDSPTRVMPGQTRPLAFRISTRGSLPDTVALRLTYVECQIPESLLSTTIDYTFSKVSIHSPHRYTYLHPSGIVSYSILRPPSQRACLNAGYQQDFPILLALHGAGVGADSYQVRHAFDAVPDLPAWILSSSGVTPWSSDDWR